MSKIGLKLLQCENGAFQAYLYEGEADMRFLFCACAIAKMLNIWSAFDLDRAVAYIRSCITYEGGFSLTPSKQFCSYSIYSEYC
ncbi:hypothetical protein EON65_05595 [archaeon]|nr:MAG: hypothetical protein EON65_05595 [archaeon]